MHIEGEMKKRVEFSPLRRGIIVVEMCTYIYNIYINLFITSTTNSTTVTPDISIHKYIYT
jgi:hypothetical protein